MSHVLVSFLGGPAKASYEPKVYQLDGVKLPETPYVGLELARHLRVDRLVVLGTAGSMWDALLYDHLGDAEYQLAHDDLLAAAGSSTVEEAQLQILQPLLERSLGVHVDLRLIPSAWTPREQLSVLQILASSLEERDRLTLDVTHGYRHLPMLGMAAAVYLQRVRKVEIRGLYYAPFNPAGPSPLVDLRGLLEILDWVQALAAFDRSGDLGAFAAPLQAAGLQPGDARRLRQAGFAERNQRQEEAASALGALAAPLERLDSPAFALFRKEFQRRTNWSRQSRAWQREFELAKQYLARADYTRAVMHAVEAAITRHLELEGADVDDIEQRKQAMGQLLIAESFNQLRFVRNALAHGNFPRQRGRREWLLQLIQNQERLPASIGRWMRELDEQWNSEAARALSEGCE